jgi:hypothetical protein
MIAFDNMLMIGATGRNSGKTELASLIISRFSKEHSIVGLKVSTYYEGDLAFHGKNEIPLSENFIILNDTNHQTDKNTARMLNSGAKSVYWLRTQDSFLSEASQQFIKQIGNDCLVVCESNSLRKTIKPGLFFMIQNNVGVPVKSTASDVIEYADNLIPFDGKSLDFDLTRIKIINNKWILN